MDDLVRRIVAEVLGQGTTAPQSSASDSGLTRPNYQRQRRQRMIPPPSRTAGAPQPVQFSAPVRETAAPVRNPGCVPPPAPPLRGPVPQDASVAAGDAEFVCRDFEPATLGENGFEEGLRFLRMQNGTMEG